VSEICDVNFELASNGQKVIRAAAEAHFGGVTELFSHVLILAEDAKHASALTSQDE